jgi:hypothetical protein
MPEAAQGPDVTMTGDREVSEAEIEAVATPQLAQVTAVGPARSCRAAR